MLGSCQSFGVGVLDALTPRNGYRAARGVAYGENVRQRLDIYQPRQPYESPTPVVVFFHGGSWNSGSPGWYCFLGPALAARGYVVVVPSYRLYPEVRFPDFVEDAARAVAWTRQKIDAFGGDRSRIFVMGHSAGAHIAALLALDEHYLRDAGATDAQSWLRG